MQEAEKFANETWGKAKDAEKEAFDKVSDGGAWRFLVHLASTAAARVSPSPRALLAHTTPARAPRLQIKEEERKANEAAAKAADDAKADAPEEEDDEYDADEAGAASDDKKEDVKDEL